jgi:N6-adenosine-specific RNA methylase IME4
MTTPLIQQDPVIVQLGKARGALIEARNLAQVKTILDVAAAAELYAKRQQLGEEAISYAHEIKIDALRKLGEMLQATPRATGAAGVGPIAVPDENRNGPPTLADLGLNKKTSMIAQRLADLPPEQFEKVRKGDSTITKAIREVEHMKRPGVALPTTSKYRVLYADPPWSYGNSGLQQYGHASHHYPTLTIEQLCALPVADLAESDAALFLWVTSPLLKDCFAVVDSWEFTYRTSFIWDKVKHNFGHYNSVRHELLLICTRGSCTPDVQTLHDSVQSIERSETHSQKPDRFRQIIDELYPRGRRIELFARNRNDGWESWGNEP